ncbi:TIGR03557 family F420-dependent LLM class oxidoreductase [Haloferax namakaokahaiae]|uniref:TIGR03557 family F420-dependent LLM class oxidoreductase n=1 Tax=Haloferax namakaokahaiae TaxID=1748331 RepID=A0ABD5ZDN2_9EURY
MVNVGYSLISEEHGPNTLVENAVRAEVAGFEYAMVSDHFHPWLDRQGESPFVWSTLGAIAQATDRLRVGTGVTCPTMRIHPALVAQAAATTAVMSDGRFFLGVGTGERLNEHVTGHRWPPHHVRVEMLQEAIHVIRELWGGEMMSHDGDYFCVENAQLHTVPEERPNVAVAASGTNTARWAGNVGDSLVSTAPDADVVDAFSRGRDDDRRRYGQATVCWAESESEGRRTIHEQWPNGGLPGELGQELATPTHFEQAVGLVTEEQATKHLPCGPDADAHIETIQSYVDAGFDHVNLHQVGPHQQEFLAFYEEEVLPSFE